MKKTPEEIKKGLSCCGLECEDRLASCRDECPYYPECDYGQVVVEDAISCIQQLQAENAQQARCIENLTEKLNATNDALAELQAERDAAVAAIPRACGFCKWYGLKHGGFFPDCKNPNGCRNISGINTGWEWRGVQKEE